MAGQTGGHVSKASFLESVKEQLILVLSNEAAYPFFTSKIEALTSNTELYPIVIDPTGVARQAHNELLASNTSQYQISANSNPALAERETKFNDMVKAIRQKYKYNESDQYIKNLETDDLLQAQALVSEYNRALNRKRVQLIVAEKSRQQPILIQPSVPQGQMPMQYVPQQPMTQYQPMQPTMTQYQSVPQPQPTVQYQPVLQTPVQQPVVEGQSVQLLTPPPGESL